MLYVYMSISLSVRLLSLLEPALLHPPSVCECVTLSPLSLFFLTSPRNVKRVKRIQALEEFKEFRVFHQLPSSGVANSARTASLPQSTQI